jgi:asparagine synthase (glutamine-hydrolysing)
MCGIAGLLRFDGAQAERRIVDRICDLLQHRGPDDRGVYAHGPVALGQRRLAIVDLDPAACAPLPNHDGSKWIVFNGEIYNFRTLRAELEALGHRFRTHTDTEVIVHAYDEFGPECVHKLRGMFAFAIWDVAKGELFAARDRLGKKPFFFARSASRLVFASEIRALHQSGDISAELDLSAIDQFLRRQCIPAPQTIFKDVSSLPPGHILTCDSRGQTNVRRYWRCPTAARPSGLDQQEMLEALRAKLREAVGIRMLADVPVGALLSAGIDSGLIVALMAEQSSQPIRTFTVGFRGFPNDEREPAQAVARQFGTLHEEITVDAAPAGIAGDIAELYGQPFADSSAIPSLLVAKAAASRVKVVLTGDGGDESFCGYQHYLQALRVARLARAPARARRALSAVARAVANPLSRLTSRAWSIDAAASAIAMPLQDMYLEVTATFKEPELDVLYRSGPLGLYAKRRAHPLALDEYPQLPTDPLDAFMLIDKVTYLPDCLLTKMDIASMSQSLEARSPFLDHELIELATQLPIELKYDGKLGKRILREMARDILPQGASERRKTGFGLPLAAWLRNELWPEVQSCLDANAVAARGLFSPEVVSRIVAEHVHGKRDWSNRIWTLLMLETWMRRFVDSGSVVALR